MTETKPKIVFFGTPEISVKVLEKLKESGFTPSLVVTQPDKPQGRKLLLTPPPVKVWAEKYAVNFIQPEKLDETFFDFLQVGDYNLFIVVSYGEILKKEILDIPKYGTLNIHPSLLPRLRGASPIKSAILTDEKKTGVSIMLLDSGMDSGPILAQASVEPTPWPPRARDLEEILITVGGELLVDVIPKWIQGEIEPEDQNHRKATFTQKIKKEDGLIELNDDPYQNLLKIRAFDEWPGTFFFARRNDKEIRVKIIDADIKNGVLVIKRVVPEGKKEMDYEDFLRG